MRALTKLEMYKRGCSYCLDKVGKKVSNYQKSYCMHEQCPYSVLDKYKSYNDFMKSKDSKILVDEFFDSGAHEYRVAFQKKTHYFDVRSFAFE